MSVCLPRPTVALLLFVTGCFGSSDLGSGAPPAEDTAPPAEKVDLDNIPVTPEQCAVNPKRDPGHVVLRRLNRTEYDNTVRDLVGDTRRLAQEFPADDYGYGFDNIGAVLSMAPLLVEKYDAAAEQLVADVWARESGPAAPVRIEAENGATATVGGPSAPGWNLWSNGELTAPVNVQASGTYRISVRAWATQSGAELARMAILLNGQVARTVDVAATSSAPQVYSVEVTLTAGPANIGARFLNDFTDSAAGTDRNLYVDWLELAGTGTQVPRSQALVRVCDPANADDLACPHDIIGRFARRAWRRPPQPEELERLQGLVTVAKSQGDDWAQGVRLALHAVLLSPNFLFRVELDPDPNAPVAHALNHHELATRLSYFLWSSTPDDELLALADAGMLQDEEVLQTQVTRMLEDPRSQSLVDNFAGQWLQVRAVPELTPDAVLFPEVDAGLKAAMKAESEQVFRAYLDEDRSFLDILSSDFTYVNDQLAAHYGLTEPGTGATMTRVSLSGPSTRGGLLTQGAVLAVTSQPNRTSPVKRGKWVLAQLLCSEPPPPPPEVEADLGTEASGTTTREKLAIHREHAACAACHAVMDPIGLGMENFDAVGRYRTQEAGAPIDPAGELPGGLRFDSVSGLSAILKEDPRLPRCVTEKLFTYALGKGDLHYQACYLHDATARFESGGYRLRELIQALVQSSPFRQRRGEE